MGQWADEWQMEFNLDKCEVMHFGRLNQGRTYSVNGRTLGRVTEQRDLGVHIHSSLKATGVTGGQSDEGGIQHAWFHWSEH